MDNILVRINELAKIQKERELTEAEKNEQQFLRKKYVKEFREGFKKTLLNTTIVDEMGNDVTPQKLKMEQLKHKKGNK